MCSRTVAVFVQAAALLVCFAPLAAQVPVVVHGRVVDAVTRDPIDDVRVMAADSSAAVFTDESGEFELALAGDAPLVLEAERLGYAPQRFELEGDPSSRVSVLLLDPQPVEIEGVGVVEESAVTNVLSVLNRRRQGSPFAYGRDDLERWMPSGSVWDFVRNRNPRMYPCGIYPGHICLPPRTRTTSDPNPETFVPVCVDGWASFAPLDELQSLDISAAVLVEVGEGRVASINVYTRMWVLQQSRRGRENITELSLACAGSPFPGGFTGDPTYDSMIREPGSEPPVPPGG